MLESEGFKPFYDGWQARLMFDATEAIAKAVQEIKLRED